MEDTFIEEQMQIRTCRAMILYRIAVVPMTDGRWAACVGAEHEPMIGYYEEKIWADWEPEEKSSWAIASTLEGAVLKAVQRMQAEKKE